MGQGVSEKTQDIPERIVHARFAGPSALPTRIRIPQVDWCAGGVLIGQPTGMNSPLDTTNS